MFTGRPKGGFTIGGRSRRARSLLSGRTRVAVPHAEPEPGRLDEVLALFARFQRRLYLYIASMLPNPAEAEEVLQETNIVVWKKFDQFRPNSDFRAWVFRIAYFEVRKHLERRGRGVTLSHELLDELSADFQER